MIAVEPVDDRHVEGSGCRPLFHVSPNVETAVVRSAVRETMYEPRIPVKCKYNGAIRRKDLVEFGICETVRMPARWLKSHQVDDIHHTNPEIGKTRSKQ